MCEHEIHESTHARYIRAHYRFKKYVIDIRTWMCMYLYQVYIFVDGAEPRFSGLGSRVSVLGFRVSGLGSRGSGLGSQVSDFGFIFEGSGSRPRGCKRRSWGCGCRSRAGPACASTTPRAFWKSVGSPVLGYTVRVLGSRRFIWYSVEVQSGRKRPLLREKETTQKRPLPREKGTS